VTENAAAKAAPVTGEKPEIITVFTTPAITDTATTTP